MRKVGEGGAAISGRPLWVLRARGDQVLGERGGVARQQKPGGRWTEGAWPASHVPTSTGRILLSPIKASPLTRETHPVGGSSCFVIQPTIGLEVKFIQIRVATDLALVTLPFSSSCPRCPLFLAGSRPPAPPPPRQLGSALPGWLDAHLTVLMASENMSEATSLSSFKRPETHHPLRECKEKETLFIRPYYTVRTLGELRRLRCF